MKLTSDFSCRLVFSAGKAGLLALFIAALGIVPGWAQQYSHARVVRLSFVEGTVTVQRPDADEVIELFRINYDRYRTAG